MWRVCDIDSGVFSLSRYVLNFSESENILDYMYIYDLLENVLWYHLLRIIIEGVSWSFFE